MSFLTVSRCHFQIKTQLEIPLDVEEGATSALPSELLVMVLSFLQPAQIACAALVSRRWSVLAPYAALESLKSSSLDRAVVFTEQWLENYFSKSTDETSSLLNVKVPESKAIQNIEGNRREAYGLVVKRVSLLPQILRDLLSKELLKHPFSVGAEELMNHANMRLEIELWKKKNPHDFSFKDLLASLRKMGEYQKLVATFKILSGRDPLRLTLARAIIEECISQGEDKEAIEILKFLRKSDFQKEITFFDLSLWSQDLRSYHSKSLQAFFSQLLAKHRLALIIELIKFFPATQWDCKDSILCSCARALTELSDFSQIISFAAVLYEKMNSQQFDFIFERIKEIVRRIDDAPTLRQVLSKLQPDFFTRRCLTLLTEFEQNNSNKDQNSI